MENLKEGDEILLTELEHHSNIVPWQLVAKRTGAVIKVAPVLDSGALDLDAYYRSINERTRCVGIVHVSDRKSTRLNSSHVAISYAVFCLRKKRGLHAQAGR